MNKQTEITIKLYGCIQWQMHCDVFVFLKNFVIEFDSAHNYDKVKACFWWQWNKIIERIHHFEADACLWQEFEHWSNYKVENCL